MGAELSSSPAELREHPLEDWWEWRPHSSGAEYTLGVEEEVMLVQPQDWALAQQIDRVLLSLGDDLLPHVTAETHMSALELATGVREGVAAAASELTALRSSLEQSLVPLGLLAAGAGTHPFAGLSPVAVDSSSCTGRCASSRGVSPPLPCTCTSGSATLSGRSESQTGCAPICHCYSRSLPTRRSGRVVTRAWRRRAPSVSGIPTRRDTTHVGELRRICQHG